jgi:LysM repeat protein
MKLSVVRLRLRGFLARWLPWLSVAILALLLSLPASAQEGGYTYTVQVGDNWTAVAKRVGLTVQELQAANRQSVRLTGWLIVGEKLQIPTAPVSDEQFYTVKAGDGWTMIAERFDIPTSLLLAANSRYVRLDLVLYLGDRLLIPPPAQSRRTAAVISSPINTPLSTDTPMPSATPKPMATPTATNTSNPTHTATAEPTNQPSATSTLIPTDTPTPSSTLTATDSPTPKPTATLTGELTNNAYSAQPACPVDLAIVSGPLLDVLNQDNGSGELLNAFLARCGLTSKGPVVGDLTDDGLDDLVIVYALSNESGTPAAGQGDLLIANGGAGDGYAIEYVAGAGGSVHLLKTEDVNGDGLVDVIWQDTTCGASTCMDTLNVRTWDGDGWQDWTDGTITMAAAKIEIADANEAGSGAELTLSGGTYSSGRAGPQRDRTEVWGSIDGAPYTLLRESYGESTCLYHLILDANRAFAIDRDFELAETHFSKAILEKKYNACWTHTNELDELRSFAFFRLVQIAAYTGDSATAQTLFEQMADRYPSQPYAQVGRIWLDVYLASEDPRLACVMITHFVTANPAAVDVLADYGYANPTFTVDDVCPIFDVTASVSVVKHAANLVANSPPRAPSEPVAFELKAIDQLSTPTPLHALAQELDEGLRTYRSQYCGVCHQLTVGGTTGQFGPSHDGMAWTAQNRILSPSYGGQAVTPQEYLRESILSPEVYIVDGYADSSHHMPSYAHLTSTEIDALVYLLEHQR